MEEKEGRKSRRAKHRDSALAAQGRSASEADETSSSSHLSSIFSLIEPVTDSKVSSCSDNKDTGKRVPRGETSIDLGAINLALGQTVSGEGSPNVESSHGGFPKFLNEARITHRRSCSNFSAYSTSSKDKTAEERIAEWRNSRDTSSVSNTPPSSMAMQRQSSQTGLNQQQNQPPSPNPQGPSNGVAPAMNGMAAGGLLVHAGQQMDINYIHTKLAELSEQHRANRAQTQQLIASTEQLAVTQRRAISSNAPPSLQEANTEISSARVADGRIAGLTQKLSSADSLIRVLKREQRENGRLIGEYEQALDKVVGMLRDFARAQAEEKTGIASRYLTMLQAERDEHLQTRFERDGYVAKIIELEGKIRTAYRLRCEESVPDVEIIAGLQNEVRGYRAALGMEPERFEEEFGWPVLRGVKNGVGEP
ncbi:MAG: hypothetical protein LQ340_001195 [Diploschistes diacapsis]|nr:MAG: hypothetical protein LQ340_001195 [Diploschistes diacapsis]